MSKPLPSPGCKRGWLPWFRFCNQQPKHQQCTDFISNSTLKCNACDNNRVLAPYNRFLEGVFSFSKRTSDNHYWWIRIDCTIDRAQICFCRIEWCAVELPCSFCRPLTPCRLSFACLDTCGVQRNYLVLPNFVGVLSFVLSHNLGQWEVLKPRAEHV